MGLPSFEKRDPPPPLPHSKFRLLMSTLGHQDKLPCVAAQALTCGPGRFLWSRNRSPRFLVGRNPWRDYHPHSRHHRPSADAFILSLMASSPQMCSSALKIPAQTNTSKQVRSPMGYDGMMDHCTKARFLT